MQKKKYREGIGTPLNRGMQRSATQTERLNERWYSRGQEIWGRGKNTSQYGCSVKDDVCVCVYVCMHAYKSWEEKLYMGGRLQTENAAEERTKRSQDAKLGSREIVGLERAMAGATRKRGRASRVVVGKVRV